MPPPASSIHSTGREVSSTRLVEPFTTTTTPRGSTLTTTSTHSPAASGSGSPNLGDTASSTPLHSSTSRRVVHSSTTAGNGPSQSSPPLSHDAPSRGVPTAAIVAAVAVSGIIVIGIIYKLWLIRSRRRGGQYGTTPLPRPRGSVNVASTQSGAGFQHPSNTTTVNSNSTTTQQLGPSENSESDEYYSNQVPLEPPSLALPDDARPVSWVSFDAPRPANTFFDRPLPQKPLPDPFSSSADDVNKRGDPENIHPVIHDDNTPPSPLDHDNDDDDRTSVVTSAAATLAMTPAPLPSYPSLPTASSSVTHESSTTGSVEEVEYTLRPGRHPRSPPPQAASASYPSLAPFSTPYAQSSPQSSYPRNSINQPPASSSLPPPPSDPYPSSSSLLDRRVSYASSVQTHRSGGARSSRHYPASGGGLRGAPHLPHVRAAVEIILPTPLAPRMSGSNVPMYSAVVGPPSSAHARRVSIHEVGGATGPARQRSGRAGSQIQRVSSRSSVVGADPWADATLSARHQEPPLPSSSNASSFGGDRAQRIRSDSQSSQSKSHSQRPTSPPAPPVPTTGPTSWRYSATDGPRTSA